MNGRCFRFRAVLVGLCALFLFERPAGGQAPPPMGKKLFYPTRAFTDAKQLYVVDSFNHRLLIYPSIEPVEEQAPAVVLGQPDTETTVPNYGGLGERSLLVPNSAISDGKVLAVADTGNHRVLLYQAIPNHNFAPADGVLGQPDFTSDLPNNGGRSARSLNYPRDVFFDGTRLYVSDSFNHRVLIYNRLPTVPFQPADVVLGQPDFTSGRPNAGGVSASSLYYPAGVFSDGKVLIICDQMNHRVKIYNHIPTQNNEPCDVVLGQPDPAGRRPNLGKVGPSQKSLNSPTSVFYDGTSLYIADFGNNRILAFDKLPGENGAPASSVMGQPDFTTR